MKSAFWLAVSTALLTGCASTKEVLAGPVTQTFHTEKTPNEVAFCFANKDGSPALDQPDGSKVVLMKNGYGGVGFSYSIYPEGTGSRIEYRHKFGPNIIAWRQCVGLKPEK